MSNLSELLPTGGGQNAVDFVASGTLSSGQTVVLKADGTVSAVTQTTSVGDITNYASVSPQSTSSQYTIVRYSAFTDRIVCVYIGSSNYGYAVVGSVSGTTINFGTPVIFSSDTNLALDFDCAGVGASANAGGIIITVRDGGIFKHQFTITPAGNSISVTNSAYGDGNSNTDYGRPIAVEYCPTQDSFVIAYYGVNDGGQARVARIGASTPTIYVVSTFDSLNNPNSMDLAWDSTNEKMVLCYRWSNSTGYSMVVTVNANNTLSYGTKTEHSNSAFRMQQVAYDSASGKVLVIYARPLNDNNLYGRVGTVSGTSISFGTAAVIYTSTGSGCREYDVCYDSDKERFFVSYESSSTTPYKVYTVPIQLSGTNFSVGTAVEFYANYAEYISNAYDSTAQKTVTFYVSSSGNAPSAGVSLLETSQSDFTDFIGITAEAISSAATGPVNVYGGINEAQTSLTIGSDYYVQADGSLSTTASSVKVGQAISSTTINMMDLT
jgi:hypothetical protein